MGNFIVSARKYRPLAFEKVVGQPSVTGTLKNAIRTGQVAHAYLFCGPRGVGKTTVARILARTLNCSHHTDTVEACGTCESCMAFAESRSYNIHELDAASNNSVEDIRSLIDQVRILPQVGKYSIYIIDEVHMLSQSAFNAFLKTLEEPPSHAVFILATTEKHKILPTILSRCQVFDFNRIHVEDIISFLKQIAESEDIHYDDEALHVIAVKADGALRDALTLFDQAASFSGNHITYKEVARNLNVLDFEYYFKITEAVINHSTAAALLLYNEILLKGFDGYHFIGGLSGHLRDLLVSHDPETLQLLEAGESMKDKYVKQASVCPSDFLFGALEICNQCEISYKSSKNQRLHVELALIRICSLNPEKKNLKWDNKKVVVPDFKTTMKKGANTNDPSKRAYIQETKKNVMSESAGDYIAQGNGLSIKDALRGKPDKEPRDEMQQSLPDDQVQTVDNDNKKINDISGEFLNLCWKAFADQIYDVKPRMAVALKNTIPLVTAENKIEVVLSNQAQIEDFDRTTRGELTRFLRHELQIPEILVEARMADAEEQKTKLYTSDEKFSYLNNKNPLLSKLKEELNLELE